MTSKHSSILPMLSSALGNSIGSGNGEVNPMLKMAILVTLCCQNAGHALLARYSQGVLKESYSSSEVVLFGEFIKMVFSGYVALIDRSETDAVGTGFQKLMWLLMHSQKVILLVVLYSVANVLSYYALARVEASVYSVVSQLKIFTTAAFSVMFLGRSVSWCKWRALMQLVVGCVLVASPAFNTCDCGDLGKGRRLVGVRFNPDRYVENVSYFVSAVNGGLEDAWVGIFQGRHGPLKTRYDNIINTINNNINNVYELKYNSEYFQSHSNEVAATPATSAATVATSRSLSATSLPDSPIAATAAANSPNPASISTLTSTTTSTTTSDTTTSTTTLSENDSPDTSDEGSALSSLLGVGAVLIMITISGYSAVYFEGMLKKSNEKITIWERNFQLAFYSIVFLLVMIVWENQYQSLSTPSGPSGGSSSSSSGAGGGLVGDYVPFRGWTLLTVLVSLLQAGGGLLVAATLKYVDSIAKTLATSGAIVLSAVLGYMLLGGTLDMFVSLGAVSTIIAIFNYTFSG